MFNKLRLPDVEGKPQMKRRRRRLVPRHRRRRLRLGRRGRGRRVGEVFALVPKKNSKTTGGAGLLTGLIENKAPRQEFLFVGPTQEIAASPSTRRRA
jgi:hypothetical protein